MRIATWNLKQAVGPLASVADLGRWLERVVQPDVAVLTEAKRAAEGPLARWGTVGSGEPVGPRRPWSTFIVAPTVRLLDLDEERFGVRRRRIERRNPSAVQLADVFIGDERWATIVGVHAVLFDRAGRTFGHGGEAVRHLFEDIEPLLESRRGDRTVVAGDFNLQPQDLRRYVATTDLIDVVDMTARARQPLPNCAGCGLGRECGHIWTHRNTGGPNPRPQQLDTVLVAPGLAREVAAVTGGPDAYPDVWALSDHAPVAVDFRR